MKLDNNNQRYTIESWVCDYGIYDNIEKSYIGVPIDSSTEAQIILNYLLKSNILNWFLVGKSFCNMLKRVCK